jgi:DNA-binding transcriptional regulator YdaS (Cro superfamily)
MKKKDAIEWYHGVKELAKALGITRFAVYQWGEDVPEKSALKIERLTAGKLRAYEEE